MDGFKEISGLALELPLATPVSFPCALGETVTSKWDRLESEQTNVP